MSVLCLHEGGAFERSVLGQICANEALVDFHDISLDAAFIKYHRYELIVITFVPSFGTPYFEVISNSLKLGVAVISLNLDQDTFFFDYHSRVGSFKYLTRLGLQSCVHAEKFKEFLIGSCCHWNAILPVRPVRARSGLLFTGDRAPSVFFVIDLRWLSAPESFFQYKKKAGYPVERLGEVKKYSESFAKLFFEELSQFALQAGGAVIYLYVDCFGDVDLFLRKYLADSRVVGLIRIVRVSDIVDTAMRCSVVVSNWHRVFTALKFLGVDKVVQIHFSRLPGEVDHDKKVLKIDSLSDLSVYVNGRADEGGAVSENKYNDSYFNLNLAARKAVFVRRFSKLRAVERGVIRVRLFGSRLRLMLYNIKNRANILLA
jgi:hypothetical protein